MPEEETQTQTQTVPPQTPPTPGEETVELEVYGEKRVVPKSQLATLAQKGLAADEKFQEAAKRSKRVDRFEELTTAMNTGGDDEARIAAFKELARDYYHMGDDQINQTIDVYRQSQTRNDEPEEPRGGQPSQPVHLRREHLPPDLQKSFNTIEQKFGRPIEDVLTMLASHTAAGVDRDDSAFVRSSIDKDPKVSVYYSREDDPDGTAKAALQERILGRVRKGEPREQVIKEELAYAQRVLGVAENSANRRMSQLPGIGPGGAGAPLPSLHPVTERPTLETSKGSIKDFFDKALAYERHRRGDDD